MKDVIITALLMAACYVMYCYGIVYGVDNLRMIVGAFALMGAAFTAGTAVAADRFKRMLSDLLDEMEAERNGEK